MLKESEFRLLKATVLRPRLKATLSERGSKLKVDEAQSDSKRVRLEATLRCSQRARLKESESRLFKESEFRLLKARLSERGSKRAKLNASEAAGAKRE
jgi:hypothetical protein